MNEHMYDLYGLCITRIRTHIIYVGIYIVIIVRRWYVISICHISHEPHLKFPRLTESRFVYTYFKGIYFWLRVGRGGRRSKQMVRIRICFFLKHNQMIYWKIDAGYNAAKHKSYFAVEAIGSLSAINYIIPEYFPTEVSLPRFQRIL